jgi:hypothetical protein
LFLAEMGRWERREQGTTYLAARRVGWPPRLRLAGDIFKALVCYVVRFDLQCGQGRSGDKLVVRVLSCSRTIRFKSDLKCTDTQRPVDISRGVATMTRG